MKVISTVIGVIAGIYAERNHHDKVVEAQNYLEKLYNEHVRTFFK